MTKTEAKKIALNKLHNILVMPSTWFEGEFDPTLLCGSEYTEEEQDMIIEQAEKIAKRVIKIIIK